MSSLEQTLSIIKPDAVERNLTDNIKSFFEKNNLRIIKSKKIKISKEEASDFYKVHQTKPFYNDLCEYLSSGPIVVMILQGENAVSKNRELMGATDPTKAKEGTLTMDDLTGGTFTISNGGVYGSMLSTPIINRPQSGILGMHNIQKRAVVVDDEIVIRPMMYLAFSYDHRIIDGKESVGFLISIKNLLENPSKLILGV